MIRYNLRKAALVGAALVAVVAPARADHPPPCATPGAPGAPGPVAAPAMRTIYVTESVPEQYQTTRTVFRTEYRQERYTAFRSQLVPEVREQVVTTYQRVPEVRAE